MVVPIPANNITGRALNGNPVPVDRPKTPCARVASKLTSTGQLFVNRSFSYENDRPSNYDSANRRTRAQIISRADVSVTFPAAPLRSYTLRHVRAV